MTAYYVRDVPGQEAAYATITGIPPCPYTGFKVVDRDRYIDMVALIKRRRRDLKRWAEKGIGL
jgi:hypothetical protein